MRAAGVSPGCSMRGGEIGVGPTRGEAGRRPGVGVTDIALACRDRPPLRVAGEEDLLAAPGLGAFESKRGEVRITIAADEALERLQGVELFVRRQPEGDAWSPVQHPGEVLGDRSDGELPQRTAPGRAVPGPPRSLVRWNGGAVVGRRLERSVE